jgi:hypothetical protein
VRVHRFELGPPHALTGLDGARQVVLSKQPMPDGGFAIRADPWLEEFGRVPPKLVDTYRVAAAAYYADGHVERPRSFVRSFELTVHLTREPWPCDLLRQTEALLSWLTGDRWSLCTRTEPEKGYGWTLPLLLEPTTQRIALFSGGLDSFAAAAADPDLKRTHLVGHYSTGATATGQGRVHESLERLASHRLIFSRFRVVVTPSRREPVRRTRIFLFSVCAAAMAASDHVSEVRVPENGFTSINPPLSRARVGALSTLSTHPTTIERINSLLAALGVSPRLDNAHKFHTKGEMVNQIRDMEGVDEAIAKTASCGRPRGRFLAAPSGVFNCGLCVACVVRRASILAARGVDLTPYLVDRLTGGALDDLIRARRSDIRDLAHARERRFTVMDVLACQRTSGSPHGRT